MTDQAMVKDMNRIRKWGIEALTEKLSPLGMVEFMRQFDSGYGDYTEWRKTNLCPGMSVDEISDAASAYCKEHP